MTNWTDPLDPPTLDNEPEEPCPLCVGRVPHGWRERAECHEECLSQFDAELGADAAIDAARDDRQVA